LLIRKKKTSIFLEQNYLPSKNLKDFLLHRFFTELSHHLQMKYFFFQNLHTWYKSTHTKHIPRVSSHFSIFCDLRRISNSWFQYVHSLDAGTWRNNIYGAFGRCAEVEHSNVRNYLPARDTYTHTRSDRTN